MKDLCWQVADFGVSAQLTRTISRRKVSLIIHMNVSIHGF